MHLGITKKTTRNCIPPIITLASSLNFRRNNHQKCWKSSLLTIPLLFDTPPMKNPHKYLHIPHILETGVIDLHFLPLTARVYLRSNFLVGSIKCIFSARVHISRSRSSKVSDFGTNQKRIRDFLLVCHSNLGPILPPFRDIEVFCSDTNPTPIPP